MVRYKFCTGLRYADTLNVWLPVNLSFKLHLEAYRFCKCELALTFFIRLRFIGFASGSKLIHAGNR